MTVEQNDGAGLSEPMVTVTAPLSGFVALCDWASSTIYECSSPGPKLEAFAERAGELTADMARLQPEGHEAAGERAMLKIAQQLRRLVDQEKARR